MRRTRAFKRGSALSILVAGSVGYLVHGWNAVAIDAELSPAQAVALRFPQNWDDAPVTMAASVTTAASAVPSWATPAALNNVQLALFSPEPMVPQAPQAMPQGAVQTAAVEETIPPPPAARITAPSLLKSAVAHAAGAIKTAVASARRRVDDRPGYMLNDAQLASIKERLHLTPDQERMWPAVEAALRNIAYVRTQEAHRRGAPAGTAQLASADPNSVEVQGLKSAAIPLLMSFNSEQKDEVRNLAHVMGLDQLASQF